MHGDMLHSVMDIYIYVLYDMYYQRNYEPL